MARVRLLKLLGGVAAVLAATLILPAPGQAGRADDTLRIATTDWWSTLDPYQFPLGRGRGLLQDHLRDLDRL